MIDPEEKKEIITLLKMLQNEEAWSKIYKYVCQILYTTENETDLKVMEPIAEYITRKKDTELNSNLFFSEKQIQEIIEAYDTSGNESEDISLEKYFIDYKKRRCRSK